MVRSMPYYLLIYIFLFGCSMPSKTQEHISNEYKESATNFELIHSKLFKGMKRTEVERLLGAADYSPIEGQYYYESAQTEYSEEQNKEVSVGMIINYNDINGTTTEYLQSFSLGPIGE